ncbi:MAG: ADP-heptose--LPS heptosyltransferase [Pseudomonadota bacterium]|nr:ADP-heptose--LPS heptosyltransferase [Pseudomonadota bacterium]
MTARNDSAPVSTTDLWTMHMQRGEWERAWAISDELLPDRAHEPCSDRPRHLQRVWNGAPLAGKRVLVRCYHGLGDTIQFIRYAPLLKSVAAEVIVWAQPKLLPLLATVEGIDRLLPLHDGAPDVAYDVDVEIMELPYIFGTTPATVPARVPYLHAAPMALTTDPWRLAVGIVWRAGEWNEARSIPWQLLASLEAVPGVAVFILQPHARQAGWDGRFGEHPGELELAEYAQVLRAMDLLISIDSMPAHLAGALGVPVWMLLHDDADWRWMQHRSNTPWYPGTRLFRQQRPGDWPAVIDRVTAELRVLASPRASAPRFTALSAGPGV